MTVAPSKHVSVVESLSQVILGLGYAARWPHTGTHSGAVHDRVVEVFALTTQASAPSEPSRSSLSPLKLRRPVSHTS